MAVVGQINKEGVKMAELRRMHVIENALWVVLVLFLFAFSFEFDKEIEIYKFGAAGWPRVVLGLLFLVIVGNIFHQMRHGDAVQAGRVGLSDDEMSNVDRNFGSTLTLALFLLTPLLYAWSLKPIGFYSATPVFIASIICLLGEFRVRRVLSITALIYGLLILLFLLVLNAPLPQGTVSPFYDFSAFMLRTSHQLQNLF